MFIGHPRYYYAYGYTDSDVTITSTVKTEESADTTSYTYGTDKTSNRYTYGVETVKETDTVVTTSSILVEKRKPFQQYHIYTSASDIISNGIVASRSKLKTAAVGLYQVEGSVGIKSQKKVGPLFVDIDIFPEDQKTMIIDTQLYGKGTSVVGFLTNSIFNDLLDPFFDDKGKVVNHERIAWRMTASALKNSVKDMYQGDLVIIGDPTVKPHDRIMIADQYAGITGQCTVKEVVMSMSVNDGFITTISPDCINVVDDRFETAINSWFGAIGRHAAAEFVGEATAIAIRYYGVNGLANKLKDLAAPKPESLAGKSLEQVKKYGGEYGKKVMDLAKELIKNGGKILKGSKVAAAAATVAGTVATGAALGAALFEAIPGIIVIIAAMLTTEVIGAFVSSFIERAVRNWQVLQIFPLKRYGITWTAGLTGSKGLVVGSPTYDEQGVLESVFSEITRSSWTDDLGNVAGGMIKNLQGEEGGFVQSAKGVLGLIMGLAANDEIRKVAQRYDVSNNVVDDEGNPTMPEDYHKNYLREMIGKSNSIAGDYHEMMIIPRADYSSSGDVAQSYKYFAITDAEQYQNNPRLSNNLFISDDYRIKKYIENGFFKLVHETPGLNKSDAVDTHILTVNGKKHYIKAIKYEDSKGNKVYDIPMLNKDALNILYEILRRTKNNMPSAKSSDKYESYDLNKSSFVALESALRIGDQESQAAAGFTFILHGVDQAAAPMYSAIKTMHDDIESAAKDNDMLNESLFDSKDLGGNKVVVTVRMPKITQEILSNGKEN